ncbi:hypothetical protein ACYZT9_12015 [Pseudomonas sp. ZT5P21]
MQALFVDHLPLTERECCSGNLALFKFARMVAPNLLQAMDGGMTAVSSIVTKQETHSGYEILVATVGPIQTNPDEPGSLLTHHKIKISIWFHGKEIREAGEAPSMLFVSREDAVSFGFEIGRMIVMQRRQSSAFKLIARTCELFKLSRLFFRNEDFRSRHGGEVSGPL